MKSICLYNGTVLSGFTAMEKSSVLIENGTITGVLSDRHALQKPISPETESINAEGAFIAPGFIEAHCHGYGGYATCDALFPAESLTKSAEESMIELSRVLVKHGVTAFNPTAYPAQESIMPESLSKLASAIGKEDGARIMGFHLEGPFLSKEKPGVMRPETVYPINLKLMEDLWNASGAHIVNMTVAPELPQIKELTAFCAEKGIILQAGHTNASYDDIVEGMQEGICHCTHMFNVMSKLDQRFPNAVGAILSHPEYSCEIIADGLHVHPRLVKMLSLTRSIDKIVLITDSLKCTGQKTGPFFANGEEMNYSGGLFRRKKDDIIAGSGMTIMQGIQNLIKFGFTLEDAVRTASTNPARILHYQKKGLIAAGMDADITVFDKDFNIKVTIVGGEVRYKA